jgi:nucleoside-diphosphate-sugar epimerase
MSKVFIFGCGYLGVRLAGALMDIGYEVGALTKNQAYAKLLKAKGIEDVIVDRLESDSWHSRVGGQYSKIINCVSSAGNGLSGYESSYYHGQASIIRWAKSQSIESFIYTSSTSVYPENSGAWVSENSLTEEDGYHSDTAQVLRKSEDLIENSHSLFKNYFILRLSGIYGPAESNGVLRRANGLGLSGFSRLFLSINRLSFLESAWTISFLSASNSWIRFSTFAELMSKV